MDVSPAVLSSCSCLNPHLPVNQGLGAWFPSRCQGCAIKLHGDDAPEGRPGPKAGSCGLAS